jgi:hypothetical protein
MNRALVCVAWLLVAAFSVPAAVAQDGSSGVLTGLVTDEARRPLAGATVQDIAGTLAGLSLSSIALLILGAILLRRVERDARNGAELDFE